MAVHVALEKHPSNHESRLRQLGSEFIIVPAPPEKSFAKGTRIPKIFCGKCRRELRFLKKDHEQTWLKCDKCDFSVYMLGAHALDDVTEASPEINKAVNEAIEMWLEVHDKRRTK